MALLNVENLTIKFGGLTAVSEVNMEIGEESLVGLIGPNGAGKTTLFRCLLGLSSFVGKIYIDNELVTKNNINEFLKKIGFISPFPDSYDSLTIEEVFEPHIRYYGVACIEAEKYLKEFGLTVSLTDKISMLSLGMKQRLNIALVLLHNPDIVVLDEPFNGLDREGISLLKKVLVELEQKDKLIIVSSHSFAELESVIDKVIMIQNGKIVKTSDFREMKSGDLKTLEDLYQKYQVEANLC